MPSKLSFKGEKPKKRKRTAGEDALDRPSAKPTKPQIEDEPEEQEDGWVDARLLEELNGPVLIAFAGHTPVALAADTAGKVFVSNLDSPATSMEPHDVRQVFVAAEIAGSKKYSLKSAQGKYLSCDKFGLLSCVKEAIGPQETWTPILKTDGDGWCFQNAYEKFLSCDENAKGGTMEIRGDAESVGFCETFKLRIQARFRKREVKETGKTDRISTAELEKLAGRKLKEHEIKNLKKAYREGGFQEALLDVRVKGKSDKFAAF
ncbi:actin-crosslinking protein [Saitoella complicata NRRL Y-17804]|uniref:FRG1-like family-domain-containing protein n=1 Tax=Saitoella complicata (strain BCRC 22490 / CBS 7301 / JCM 7358 / NBRC 10748 / NRRL Y-17804) TaxID=698492 RepID=A0A0E9NA84_SAICN|nr:actin-crosslinking protein [Saitoella complicata NRRL Y-17804]ODQ55888.1 actin-crosslinking protein [Saitoella complicata NRRL Y-17804]GAO46797.1 hypothetical protein G7K_1016-t1 [Saitoella complicata NRRL Y-17804]